MAKYRFKVMFNGHREYSGPTPGQTDVAVREYKKGEIIETDKELDKMFENKFQRLAATGRQEVLSSAEFLKQEAAKNSTNLEAEEKDLEIENPNPSELDEEIEEGKKKTDTEGEVGPEDLTSQFKLAKASDLKVFFDGDKYDVVDPDDKDQTPLNKKKKLKSKDDVISFLKSHNK